MDDAAHVFAEGEGELRAAREVRPAPVDEIERRDSGGQHLLLDLADPGLRQPFFGESVASGPPCSVITTRWFVIGPTLCSWLTASRLLLHDHHRLDGLPRPRRPLLRGYMTLHPMASMPAGMIKTYRTRPATPLGNTLDHARFPAHGSGSGARKCAAEGSGRVQARQHSSACRRSFRYSEMCGERLTSLMRSSLPDSEWVIRRGARVL